MRQVLLIFAVLFFADVALAQVAIDPIFIPPPWLQDVLLAVKGLPIVGPYVVEILKWVGVGTVLITSICAALIACLKVLGGALKLVKLDALAAKVEAFQNSKIIYYLKYISNLNAHKAPVK